MTWQRSVLISSKILCGKTKVEVTLAWDQVNASVNKDMSPKDTLGSDVSLPDRRKSEACGRHLHSLPAAALRSRGGQCEVSGSLTW